jgi:hypothetical protein
LSICGGVADRFGGVGFPDRFKRLLAIILPILPLPQAAIEIARILAAVLRSMYRNCMLKGVRFKLHFGPYRAAQFKYGAVVEDVLRGKVTIVGLSAGRTGIAAGSGQTCDDSTDLTYDVWLNEIKFDGKRRPGIDASRMAIARPTNLRSSTEVGKQPTGRRNERRRQAKEIAGLYQPTRTNT